MGSAKVCVGMRAGPVGEGAGLYIELVWAPPCAPNGWRTRRVSRFVLMHVELPIRIYMFNRRIPITLEVEELVLVKQSFREKCYISGISDKYFQERCSHLGTSPEVSFGRRNSVHILNVLKNSLT